MKPRLTASVRHGWRSISNFVSCELDAAQLSQFECKELARRQAEGKPDTEPPPGCQCYGCTNVRCAHEAIAWIDARIGND